jgi:hypothetical protein
VQHREHDDHFVGRPKVNRVREGVQQCSAEVARDCRELEGPLADARERLIDIFEKSLGEPGSLVLIPPRGILEIASASGRTMNRRAIAV